MNLKLTKATVVRNHKFIQELIPSKSADAAAVVSLRVFISRNKAPGKRSQHANATL